MKIFGSLLVVLVGVVAIVFGVMFIMQAGSSRTTLSDELKASNVTLATLNAAYDQAKAGLEQATAAKNAEAVQSAGWQKASLSVAKSSVSTINFVEKSGILNIVMGVGFIFIGLFMFMKRA